MHWLRSRNQKSYTHGTSSEVTVEGVFVPSLGLKAQSQTTLTAANITKTG